MYHNGFFNNLTGREQEEILYFARAYLRVRELHNDKSFHPRVRQGYKELFEKLDEHLEE